METIQKNIIETITKQSENPILTPKNKKLFRVAAKIQKAYQVWKFVDRDNGKLNKTITKIWKELDK